MSSSNNTNLNPDATPFYPDGLESISSYTPSVTPIVPPTVEPPFYTPFNESVTHPSTTDSPNKESSNVTDGMVMLPAKTISTKNGTVIIPPSLEPVNPSQYRTHTLLNDDSDSDSDSDDDSDDNTDKCSKDCDNDATCTIDGNRCCNTYKVIYDHYSKLNKPVYLKCTIRCRYPQCRQLIAAFVEDSDYADGGFYCKDHVEHIDMIMLEDMTLKLALEDSKELTTQHSTITVE